MTVIEQVDELLARLSPAEKAEVLEHAMRDIWDAFPGIESKAGICGGEPCIVRTRIPVWTLVEARRLGVGEAELLRCYPSLRAEDLAHAWAFARAHAEDTERQIRQNEEA